MGLNVGVPELRWVLAALLCGCCVRPAATKAEPEPEVAPEMKTFAPVAARIAEAARAGHDGWRKLEQLCDEIGPRLSGSSGYERAVEWSLAELRRDGLSNVRKEPASVPRWVRGAESLELLEPHRRWLPMLGLGMSVGTPAEGIRAEVAVVRDEAELNALGAAVSGKIVLFHHPMPPYDPEKGSRYGDTAYYRGRGASLAARHGAVAALVVSATATSLSTPHTGGMGYADGVPRIPAAAITREDSASLARLAKRGVKIVANLKMEAKDHGMVESASVVGELVGREQPDEIVVLGCHLDSWDVGHGAHDDGAGCVTAMEAVALLKRLGLTPRRTLRVVLFANEENGVGGAKAYAKAHAAELDKHVAAIEHDSGAFRPLGFRVQHRDEATAERLAEQVRPIASLLGSIDATQVKVGYSGVDVRVALYDAGVPLLGLWVDGSRYFDYHHSPADTLDKVEPEDLTRGIIALATVGYVLAEMPGRLR